jgi:glucokinase
VIAAVALDLGGTKIAAATVTRDGGVLGKEVRHTPVTDGAPEMIKALVSMAGRQVERSSECGMRIEGVGVATGGAVDVTHGVITHATTMLPGWHGLPLARLLSDQMHLPVCVENDANAMALGEYTHGAAQGCRDVLCVTVGTGVGGALIRNGQLVRGVHSMAGGIGHIVAPAIEGRICECGGIDHIECYASGRAIQKAYAANSRTTPIPSVEGLGRLAERNDPTANSAIRECADALGRVLGGLLNVLDIERVVIGGGVSQLGSIYLRPLEVSIRKETYIPGVEVRQAALGPDAALVGMGVTVFGAGGTASALR